MGILRLEAVCEADNEASIRSVTAAGMQHEGTLRSYFISKAGTPMDAQVFGLAPNDLANALALRTSRINSE
jgi:RimJ/RimL family protein N-acetyltransferase